MKQAAFGSARRAEVDEALVGGQHEGTRGRGDPAKTLIMVGVEAPERARLGRVWFRIAEATEAPVVIRFVKDHILSGAAIIADRPSYSSNI